jgi:hypothetical protein
MKDFLSNGRLIKNTPFGDSSIRIPTVIFDGETNLAITSIKYPQLDFWFQDWQAIKNSNKYNSTVVCPILDSSPLEEPMENTTFTTTFEKTTTTFNNVEPKIR